MNMLGRGESAGWAWVGIVCGAMVGISILVKLRASGWWPLPSTHTPGSATGSGAVDLGLVRIAPGTFIMGNPDEPPSDDYDQHAHRVTLTRPFAIAAKPTTVGQFAQFVDETGYRTDAERAGRGQGKAKGSLYWFKRMTWRTTAAGLPSDTPVVVVSWNDAVAYCQWASGRTGLAVRLPTEAEWEYACRAGTTGPYNAAGPVTDLGWFAENSATPLGAGPPKPRPQPVGRKRPNAWGLFDMHGNVWQWCADAFGQYPAGPITDPTGPKAERPMFRSARCASWCDEQWLGTSYNRGRWTPDVGYNHIGFRVAADVR